MKGGSCPGFLSVGFDVSMGRDRWVQWGRGGNGSLVLPYYDTVTHFSVDGIKRTTHGRVMKPKCFKADRESKCASCAARIFPGDDVAWTQVTVRVGRTFAGRIMEKPAYRVRHWICPYNNLRASSLRAEQVSLFESVAKEFPENLFYADVLLAIHST